MKLNYKLHNKFVVKVGDKTYVAENTMMDYYLRRLSIDMFSTVYIHLCEKSTAPDSSEMYSDLGSSVSTSNTSYSCKWIDSMNAWAETRTCTFGIDVGNDVTYSSLAYTIYNNTIGSHTLVSRALLTDQNGNLITIHKTDLDTIYVEYTMYIELTSCDGVRPAYNNFIWSMDRIGSSERDPDESGPSVINYSFENSLDTAPYSVCVSYRYPDTAYNYFGGLISFKSFAVEVAAWKNDSLPRIVNETLSRVADSDNRAYHQKFYGLVNPKVYINGIETHDFVYNSDQWYSTQTSITNYSIRCWPYDYVSEYRNMLYDNAPDRLLDKPVYYICSGLKIIYGASASIYLNQELLPDQVHHRTGIFDNSNYDYITTKIPCYCGPKDGDHVIIHNTLLRRIIGFVKPDRDTNSAPVMTIQGSNDMLNWEDIVESVDATRDVPYGRDAASPFLGCIIYGLINENAPIFEYYKIKAYRTADNTDASMKADLLPICPALEANITSGSIVLAEPVNDDALVTIDYTPKAYPKDDSCVLDVQYTVTWR